MDSSGNAVADFGRFLTGFLVLMGIGELLSLLQPSFLCRICVSWNILIPANLCHMTGV